ncbi:MAG: GTP-binding protein [Candidatus Lokiarchaeota archaeon]|nr:GTP-binding protein [Candidatus Lokiarchaeota archaeon]
MLKTTCFDESIKVSIIGYPAVGKTTIVKMLSQKEITKKYIPTAGFDLKTVKFGTYKLKVWDFGGQTHYIKTYLKDFILGSDLIFVVTDSTPKNVLNSRHLVYEAKDIMLNDCPIIAIANKQDLCKKDGRMDFRRVEYLLHTKTIGLTATNSEERRNLMQTIENELNQVLKRKRLTK